MSGEEHDRGDVVNMTTGIGLKTHPMHLGCTMRETMEVMQYSARVEVNWIKVTRPPICYRNHHLRRPDIDIIDMDDVRRSLSKLKKDLKHRLGGKKRAIDRAGANAAGEMDSSSASLLRPDSRVVVSGHDGEGSGISAGVSQAHSRGPSPHPEPVPADEGYLDDPQRKEIDVDKKEVSRRHSSLDPDAEGAAGSGPGQEMKQASSPPPVTLVPRKQESNSTWMLSPQLLHLTTFSGDADTSAVCDHTPQEVSPGENAEPGTAVNEKKSSWKSTALATAKLLLRGVRDSADAFGPLKSVAGGLCFILENCEVWSSLHAHHQNPYIYPSE